MRKANNAPPSPSSTGGVNVHYGSNNINAGPLKEIEEISVDHFYGASLKSSAFFLTHAHTDHMVGLEGPDFLRRLNEPGVALYTHGITPMLLTAFDRYLGGRTGQNDLIKRKKLVPCDTLTPFTIKLKALRGYDQYFWVTVTLLPAEHCPGSVMFLFETEKLRILHTGDFRQPVTGFKSLEALHDPRSGILKKINHLYIDTTFCSTGCGSLFPLREDVITKAIKHVGEWINGTESNGNWIYIKFAAKFAHEYMLIMLYRAFGKKIHISERRQGVYQHLKPLVEATTLDGKSTPLHFCEDRNCKEGLSLEMKLSSMWYALRTNNNPQLAVTRGGRGGRGRGRGGHSFTRLAGHKSCDTVIRTARRLNVCYSMHPSLQEVVDTIEYLKPEVVTPLVRPMASDLHDIKQAFRQNCTHSFLYADHWSPSEVINPDQGSVSKTNKSRFPDDVDVDPESLDPLGPYSYSKYPEDIDPDDGSSDSDSETDPPNQTAEKVKFDPDPIEDIASNFLFDNFDLSPKKVVERIPITDPRHPYRRLYQDSPPPESPSPTNSQKSLVNSQGSNPEVFEIPSSPDFKLSPPCCVIANKRRRESDSDSGKTPVVKKLVFGSVSTSNNLKTELSPPIASGSKSFEKFMNRNSEMISTSTNKRLSSSPIEVITIMDDSETDYEEMESNSSNSQKSQSLLA